MIADLTKPIEGRTPAAEKELIHYRRGMAILGLAFPTFFLVSSFIAHHTAFQTSLSAYYWTQDLERNFFVGALSAIGIFLLLYKGYTKLEDRLLDIAGGTAIGVAFIPMSKAGDCAPSGFSLHGAFAIVFFVCIFLVCLRGSLVSLARIADENRRKRFKWAYILCSAFMVFSVAAAGLTRFLPKDVYLPLCEHSIIFWLESIGVWAFSAYWYIKTRELDVEMSWVPLMKKKPSA